jgi:hypothetical protein
MTKRDRAIHERETGSATLEDELMSLERVMNETQARLAGLRRKWRRDDRDTVPAQDTTEVIG